jgi:hypothetical protein
MLGRHCLEALQGALPLRSGGYLHSINSTAVTQVSGQKNHTMIGHPG